MEKRNSVEVGRTPCDRCSKPAVAIGPDGEALCAAHLPPSGPRRRPQDEGAYKQAEAGNINVVEPRPAESETLRGKVPAWSRMIEP
jgi:hypothetical protein